jgi:hypothetical protein
MDGHRDEPPDVQPDLGPGTNILCLTPSLGDRGQCGDAFCPSAPAATNVLVIAYTRSPDHVVNEWRDHLAALPDCFGVIDIGGTTRSAAATPTVTDPYSVATESPRDLTGLGITVSQHLEEWAGNGNQTVVCFDSLTALLQYAAVDRVFRFLHVLTRRMQAIDAVAHYHLDPAAHATEDVAALKSLFDTQMEL